MLYNVTTQDLILLHYRVIACNVCVYWGSTRSYDGTGRILLLTDAFMVTVTLVTSSFRHHTYPIKDTIISKLLMSTYI